MSLTISVVPDDFVIASNPEEGSSLPYVVRLPLGPAGIVLKVRDTWPVVVEDRYSSVFKLDRVRPAVVADGLAEAQVPTVPIVFCENRKLAQEWTDRFLGAAVAHVAEHREVKRTTAALPLAGDMPAPEPTPADIRAWAKEMGLQVSDRGRIPADLRRRFDAAWGT